MNKTMMAEPLVSVVMPAYKCADTIKKAIDSVLIQDVPLELIVINNGSPDNLDQIMEQYASDERVIYTKNEVNLGASGARNKGVRMARGKYTAFLDSDDWWEKGKLKKQLELLEKEQAVLCSTARELVTPQGKLTGRIIGVREQITYRSLLLHNCINCSSVVLLTKVALEFPMQHEDSHEDYIMWLSVLKKYGRAVAINEPLLKYRLSAKGKSGSKFKSASMTFKVYRYCGLGLVSSCFWFCAYAVNGVWKYAKAYLKK